MKFTKFLFVACLAFAVLLPMSAWAQTTNTPRGVVSIETDQSSVADGSYDVYVDLRYFKRTDIRVVQDGGSGTISFTVNASWDPGGDIFNPETGLDYDNVGVDVYLHGTGTFIDAIEKLLDAAQILQGATWVKLTFTVSGAASDASYKVITSQVYPKV